MFSAIWASVGNAGAWASNVLYSAYVGLGQAGSALGAGIQSLGNTIGI